MKYKKTLVRDEYFINKNLELLKIVCIFALKLIVNSMKYGKSSKYRGNGIRTEYYTFEGSYLCRNYSLDVTYTLPYSSSIEWDRVKEFLYAKAKELKGFFDRYIFVISNIPDSNTRMARQSKMFVTLTVTGIVYSKVDIRTNPLKDWINSVNNYLTSYTLS